MKNDKELTEYVNSLPTKYPQGFINSEVDNFCKELNIDVNLFWDNFGVNTCQFIDGDHIFYKVDIFYTLRTILLNKKINSFEWD